MFNSNIEDFIESFGINFKKEKYITENIKVLIDKNNNQLYLISSYNFIICISTNLKEIYELKRILLNGKFELKWVKVL